MAHIPSPSPPLFRSHTLRAQALGFNSQAWFDCKPAAKIWIVSKNLRPSLRFNFFPFLARYLFASLVTVATTVILYLLRGQLNTPLVALIYLIPVGVSTVRWGLGPGLMVAVLAFVGFNYFFIEPLYTLSVHQPRDVLVLVVFLIAAVAISQLVGRAQAGMEAASAREREATRLYELSTALAGLHDAQAIARIVAEHAAQTFSAEWVELGIEPRGGAQVVAVGSTLPPRKPDQVVPLQTARGLQGEIRMWRQEPPLTLAEDRLLRTFASQGALALERAHLALAETRARVLEESDQLKTALLSSVSHELRTPLATIKASATSLRNGMVDWNSDARQELLSAIDEEADHLNRLVGNLLDMSRIESGALKPDRKWNVLAEIVTGVVSRMRHTPAASERPIEVDVPEDLPLVPVDYVQIEQVFTNLISNSLKYAPPHAAVRVSSRVIDREWILVQVYNQGPPVPEQHLERIFDKFYRVTAADRVTGTGLGLSICKGIITAHGGRIWAENVSGGFVFNFTLPLTRDGEPPPQLPVEPDDT